MYLLASLPEKFDMLITAFEANAEVPKMDVVVERLMHEERKVRERRDEHSDKALYSRDKKGPMCYYCKTFGHIKRECPKLLKLRSGEKAMSKRPVRQRVNNVETKSDDSSDESIGLVACHAVATNSDGSNAWLVDSGATCHMCNDRKMFAKFSELTRPVKGTLGDGRSLGAVGTGDVVLYMELSKGKVQKCRLSNVQYVPNLSYNLMSVSQLGKTGKTTEFSGSGCKIKSKSGTVVASARSVGNLYYLNIAQCEQVHVVDQTKEDVWHRRYGHLNVQSLRKLARENLVEGFTYDMNKEISFCEPCAAGKHHRSKFPSSDSKRCQEVLGLIHSDVCGKINTQSLSGAQYFLTFVDDKSRYTWVYVLKRKDQVYEKFKEFKVMIEKATGRQIKALRTDNGGEYRSSQFENFLKDNGIKHELTIPKTPEQNGCAERMNRTLVEMVRSMLSDSNLPHRFWAEALSTAVYIRNRCPTNVLQGTTPVEELTDKKPNVKHLKVFGCKVFAHIPKDERDKLDPKARRCIFLGYGEQRKGYRLYDNQQRKVIYSRDVLFVEENNGFETEKEQVKQYVELDSGEREQNTEEPVVECAEDDGQRRSNRERHPPSRYGEWVTLVQSEPKEPKNLGEAMASPERSKWQGAVTEELQSLQKHEVWELVELPEGRKAVGNRWVFKVKVNAEGEVERYKARLVAQGYSQKYGSDYNETFSPVVRPESVRMVLAIAAKRGFRVHHMDVNTAFLNGILSDEVYMDQPQGYAVKGKENLVCKLKRSLYGLKQSSRCWNEKLDEHLKSQGFAQSKSDPCVYTRTGKEGEMVIVGVHVDDLFIATKSDKQMRTVKSSIANSFEVKDLGELKSFLGMQVNQSDQGISISQKGYTRKILQKYGMEDAKSVSTPVDTSTILEKADNGICTVDRDLYQSAVGSLLYLSTWSRPDIAFAVGSVARFCSCPTKEHWLALKRILRYLKGTENHGLMYVRDEKEQCVGYCDADWAGDKSDRKSTSGYVFIMSGAPVSWCSRKQLCVALSTAEAEYVALASATQEAVWLRELSKVFGCNQVGAMVIFEDNQAAIEIAKNPQFHGRMKHIEINCVFGVS